jgi:HEAT repeat protein
MICNWSLARPGLIRLPSSKIAPVAQTTEWISNLRSEDRTIREGAIKRLIEFAQTSQTARGSVIRDLVQAVDSEEELDGTHRVLKKTFLFWQSVNIVFLELKAVEAADVLVRCIQCSNGYTGRFGEPPASITLVRLGNLVLAKLSTALLSERDPSKRISIATCISRIGGPDAIAVLKRGLRAERDPRVRNAIRSSLSNRMSHN